jgi:hypothetical protein
MLDWKPQEHAPHLTDASGKARSSSAEQRVTLRKYLIRRLQRWWAPIVLICPLQLSVLTVERVRVADLYWGLW